MAVSISPDLVIDAHASLGEGPVWDAERRELLWVDIDSGLVHRFSSEDGSTSVLGVDQPVSLAVPRAGGGLALAIRDGFALLDDGAANVELVAPVESRDPDSRMNDGACDPAGRLWAGTLSGSRRPSAALYRWEGEDQPTLILDHVTISNGIGWSPDARQMHYVDTATRGVDSFDYDADSGDIANRRRLITVDPADGKPDGLAVDADGGIWVALWGGSAVHRYTPDGALDQRVPLPVSQVTSCCFGDPDLSTLYVTSAARGVDEPHAGALFACRPSCTGLPSSTFRG
jgi:sugar lactone lactonase YvrE